MKILTIILFLVFSVNAQNIDIPISLHGYSSKPEFRLVGNVNAVITTSYRNGILLGDIIVERFDSKQRKAEKMSVDIGKTVESENIVNLSYKQYFTYNETSEKLIEIRSFTSEGIPTAKVKFVYSNKGELTDKDEYSLDAERKEVTIISTDYYDDRVLTDKYTLQYNDKNQWIKRTTYNKDDTIKNSVTFEYDKQGLLAKKINCCEYNFYHTYEYKFDKKGNWIEQIETYYQENEARKWIGLESMRTYRTITYNNE